MIPTDITLMRGLVNDARCTDFKRERCSSTLARKKRIHKRKHEVELNTEEKGPVLSLGAEWVMESFDEQMKKGDLSRMSKKMIEDNLGNRGFTGRFLPKIALITREMQIKIIREMLMRDDDHVREICSMAQRTEGWFAARLNRITGSKAGSASGFNVYETPDKLIVSLLWPSVISSPAMINGTKMERFGAKSFLRKIRLEMNDPNAQLAIPGLIVCKNEPMLAYSADGIVIFSDGTRKLIEIKCPFKRKPYPSIPKMYDCQMALGMHILNLNSCYFVTYCGTGVPGVDSDTYIKEIPRNRIFTETVMLPAMRKFFFRRYLPMKVCFDLDILRQGQCHVPHGVRVEYLNESIWDELIEQT
jgi:putative phage-type endonuclease